VNGDIIDLAAFRAAKLEAKTKADESKTVGIELRYEEGRGVILDLDLEDSTQELAWTIEGAQRMGQAFMRIAGNARAYERSKDPAVIKARELEREKRAKRAHVPITGRDGRKLPPLKVRGWALETLGGHTGADAPAQWVRMTRPRSNELAARQLIDEYIAHGYRPDRVRVVPVDHRGRVIPPERMPAS
jgi:hypothetical protein